MQIWDRGPERFDELARRVETALARLRGGIVIVVLGREQFIDDRQVAPIPAPVVELTDGRLQLVAHLADPVGRQKATVTDGSRQHSRRRAPYPFPTSRPTRESTLALRRGPEGPRRSSRLEAASRPSRRKIPAHNVAFKTCPAHSPPLAIAVPLNHAGEVCGIGGQTRKLHPSVHPSRIGTADNATEPATE